MPILYSNANTVTDVSGSGQNNSLYSSSFALGTIAASDTGSANLAASKANDYAEKLRAGLWQQTAQDATSNSIEKVKLALESGKMPEDVRTYLQGIAGSSWPNALQNNENIGSDPNNPLGFLSTKYLSPTVDGGFNASDSSGGLFGTPPPNTFTFENAGDVSKVEVLPGKLGNYEWKDWTGQKLADAKNLVKTEDRFKAHRDTISNANLLNDRYSFRDFAMIFGDTRTDYFRFGLQTIDNLAPFENPENGDSTLRLDNFKGTPWEQQDPVYYGFDIIFDAVSSPLLNGSVLDFLANYTGVSELSSRILIYDEFINQFTKFFRTNAKPRQFDVDSIAFTKNKPHFTGHANSTSNFADLDENTKLFRPGKPAYLAHYIKKVSGLDLLIEANKGDTFKYVADWKKDMLQISTTEDITLSMSALAHLYKLLYWSRPHGKQLIPENLLRFNCDIIVSEVRNMQRVRKNAQTGNLEVLKDNCARWVFSLRECQFYFDKFPVENDVDLGGDPKQYESFTFNIDFKYSTHRLERFVPNGDWGSYLGYDAGSIWKIGNKGTDSNRTGTSSLTPNPAFITIGNTLNENGVTKPYVVNMTGDGSREATAAATSAVLDLFKKNTENAELESAENAKNIDAIQQTQKLKPGQALQKVISSEQTKKALNFVAGVTGITPAKVQQSAVSAIRNSKFFDVQGQLGGTFPLEKSKGSETQKKLLNNTLNKIYSVPLKAAEAIVLNPPPPTAFFDIKGQLKDFLGGPLGDKVTEE